MRVSSIDRLITADLRQLINQRSRQTERGYGHEDATQEYHCGFAIVEDTERVSLGSMCCSSRKLMVTYSTVARESSVVGSVSLDGMHLLLNLGWQG